MKRIWGYLRQYKKILIFALILATINQIFSLIDPQISRIIIDTYAIHASNFSRDDFLTGVLILLLASVGAALISRIAKNFQDYYVHVITQRLGAKMYAYSVWHSFSLPYAVFEDQRSGELLQKLEKARSDAQTLVTNMVNIVFLSFVGVLFVLVYAFIVHWSVGLAYAAMIPLLGGVTFFMSRRIKKTQSQIVSASANLAGSTTETIRNVELVKSLGLEQQEIERLNSVNDKILELELQKVIILRKFSFIQGTIINALRSILLLLMLWLIFTGDITLGQYFSLLFYSFFIFNPLSELGVVATNFQEAKASMHLLEEILQIKPERRPIDAVDTGPLQSIIFSHINFAYSSQEKQFAIQDISLEIKKGQTVAFVGPSGSGKTTMVKLLSALYHPTSGSLLFNGLDSKQIDVQLLRKRIGLVSQETQLFSGTIRENLLFVKPDATDKECLDALSSASASSLLKRATQGLDSVIGEGGMKLSGGERQRLAIARALLRKPDMIIFDEATSSLDSITERAITETIKNVHRQSHSSLLNIVVAHRLSTVLHADRIYVFERGKIVEQGTHKDLLSLGGLYAALWREQSG